MSEAIRPTSSDSASWSAVAALLGAVLVLELAAPLPLVSASFAGIVAACGFLGATAVFYRHVRINDRFSACCIGLIQALLFSVAGSLLSYLVARSRGPLWDPVLHGWDSALGLDWLAYARFVDAHPPLVLVYRLAYASLIPQTVVVILALGFSGRLDHLRVFVLAAILSGSIAILASPFFPAVGNFAYLGLHPHDFARVWQSTGLADVRDFLAVRSGTLPALDLRTMQGIIVFPSYHGALATVTLWAFWRSGLRWLGWAGAATAIVTIAATPADGGHYFVDVFAGIAIAIVSIAAALRLVRVRVTLPRITAWPFRRSREAFAR